MRILLTTTSYQDTPGPHHDLLNSQGWEVIVQRGPLTETAMLELVGGIDGVICGDDAFTQAVLNKALPRLKAISKYGIGLDKIDLEAATNLGIPVLFTPGVNHTTVAEHTFCLLLALCKNLVETANATRSGEWKRLTGHELWRKKIGLIGLGRIGQEVARRAHGFDMEVHGYGNFWPADVAEQYNITRHDTLESLFSSVDIISPHSKLTDETRNVVNAERLALMPTGSYVVNTGRGEMVDTDAVLAALDSGQLAGFGTDVMVVEPPDPKDPVLLHPKTLVTSHVGSRTYESVPRQAMKATNNLINYLRKDGEVFCANGLA